ncbi:universal stress protein [Paraflavitalea soli]|nr:universal stress protein [Paraflavitalea soli]
MKTLIVATDFSAIARNATQYAMEMARAIEASVHLLHVYQLPANYGMLDIPISMPDWEQGTEDLMDGLKKQLEQDNGGQVSVSTEVRMGDFVLELTTVCDRLQPYAVIMGCKGSTAVERVFLGTHAIQAMKHLVWPVITVPLEAKFNVIRKIGLACDLAEPEMTVPLDSIIRLVTDFKATLHVINTHNEQSYDPQLVSASGWLGAKLKDVQHKFHFIKGDTEAAILHFAQSNNMDLLIVLPRQHSFWDTLIYKSHTKQFVLKSHIPLMALHFQGETAHHGIKA